MSVTAAAGFKASGIAAGLKTSGAPDVALVVNDGPISSAAAVFTSNRCKANPVLWSEQAISTGSARAVVLNSGGANCYTGAAGFQIVHETAELAGELLGVGPIDVQVCSTGLIGLLNDKDDLLGGVREAVSALSADGGAAAATAIMTTDTVSKQAVRTGGGAGGYTIGAMAKGAGMLAPALATMLVVITTDADLAATDLDAALRAATAQSFDRLDSDGCQSTNDTVLLMASGAAEVSPDLAEFTSLLTEVCRDLALQLLADAEGADHEIAIETVNAASEQDALEVSRSVARSNLFKCAIFGKDPNWGRILASVGTTDAAFDPADLDVALNGVWVCRQSGPAEDPSSIDLEQRAVTVTIDLKAGKEAATIWTNDLTQAYVHENSAYSS
ncbi:MAG: bifunctional glutamate N-acetyltransferase/amino-acid acetyltransferase ArgJ [Aeromicrobium sp.]|uniref:bifunctional glutamate N-acetyltransferase/amino-acid acetyltransferase ArgJ n=1 Tax=Aeromicrobium sp. TaxID=1871063 RepID=UPI0025BFF905|nr:bifunctional glutamate N-acetyltransferase/amino-acid acetyltransferase ArgJ [Aeromicrobium sp.]MCK5892194.1 bifunctional glutamate N-acetyltransferase/amino-acid acetyltransferase ArgJ [Aeromicrobium sp.]MDF1705885.1 bifunctional glutamate N-acetyltransferase/amino-acid acetyltransferase ArgJ [Aeromicrobium sp.]